MPITFAPGADSITSFRRYWSFTVISWASSKVFGESGMNMLSCMLILLSGYSFMV